jgi:hypothetical protein
VSSHADIAKDEIVAIKAGNIITRAEIEQATDMAGDMALQIDDDFYLAPRDISAGEELCHDYAMERSDDYALDCHCGSLLCRGKVSGEDWKRPDAAAIRGLFFLLHQKQDTARVAL